MSSVTSAVAGRGSEFFDLIDMQKTHTRAHTQARSIIQLKLKVCHSARRIKNQNQEKKRLCIANKYYCVSGKWQLCNCHYHYNNKYNYNYVSYTHFTLFYTSYSSACHCARLRSTPGSFPPTASLQRISTSLPLRIKVRCQSLAFRYGHTTAAAAAVIAYWLLAAGCCITAQALRACIAYCCNLTAESVSPSLLLPFFGCIRINLMRDEYIFQ